MMRSPKVITVRGRLTAPHIKREYHECPHCKVNYSVGQIEIHVEYCPANNNKQTTLFPAQGKQFIRKLPAPRPLSAPALRIAALTVEGKSYPILLDHAVMLLGMKLIKRAGVYRHDGIAIQCYVTTFAPDLPAGVDPDAVWKIIGYARKAGAKLT